MINRMLQRFGYVAASQAAQTLSQAAAAPAAQAATGPVVQAAVKKAGFFTRLGQLSAFVGLGAAGWMAYQNDMIREAGRAMQVDAISPWSSPIPSDSQAEVLERNEVDPVLAPAKEQAQRMVKAISSGSSIASQIFGPSITQEQIARAKLSKPIEEMKRLSVEYKGAVEHLKLECGKDVIDEEAIGCLLDKVQKLRVELSGLRDGAVVMLQSCKDQVKVADLTRTVKEITDVLNAHEADPEMSDLKLRAEMRKAKEGIVSELESLKGVYEGWKKVKDQEGFPDGPQLTALKSSIASAEDKYRSLSAEMKKSQKGDLGLRKEIIGELEGLSKSYNEMKDAVAAFEKSKNAANKKSEVKIQAEELFRSLEGQIAEVGKKEADWLASFDQESSESYRAALGSLGDLLETAGTFLISSEAKEYQENTESRKRLLAHAKVYVDEKKSNLAFAETSDRILNRSAMLERDNKELAKQLEALKKENKETKERLKQSESDLSAVYSTRRWVLGSVAVVALGYVAVSLLGGAGGVAAAAAAAAPVVAAAGGAGQA